MNREQFNKALDHIRSVSLDTLKEKNAKYSEGSVDPLHNFKRGADMTNGTMATAAWGYLAKHLVALHDKVCRNDFSDLADLEEKCKDAINYISFLYIIGIAEHESNAQKKYAEVNKVIYAPDTNEISGQITIQDFLDNN